jgi:hypothetical protein
MPSVPDLTPDEIAAVLEARRRHAPVEDELPASLTARLDREVATRVDAELAARGAGPVGLPGAPRGPQPEQRSFGARFGLASMVLGIPLMGIVEGTSHGSLGGAAIVMAGIVLVNVANALGRRGHR